MDDFLTILHENTSDIVCFLGPNLRLEIPNPSFIEIFGNPLSKNLNLRLPDLFDEGVDTAVFRQIAEYISVNKPWRDLVLLKQQNGKIKLYELLVAPMLDKKFDEEKAIVIIKKHHPVLWENDSITRFMRLETLGLLAGGISHELNNKLSVILGYTGVAKRKCRSDKDLTGDLSVVVKAAHEATNVVQELVKFCRSDGVELKPMRAQFIVKEVLRFLRTVLPSTISISDELTDNCVQIRANPELLHHLFAVLGSGALSFLEGGGDFHVEIVHDKQSVLIRISMSTSLYQGVLDVQAEIFTKHFNMETIGVLAQKMNVSWTNAVDTYGRIVFGFAFKAIEKEIQLVTTTKFEDLRGNEKILYVDDEHLITKLMKRSLSRLGYDVTTAVNGKTAYEKWLEHNGEFDLIITDMTMPVMSGAELAEKVVMEQPEAKIILCTGYSNLIDEDKALQLGISEYLSKPVSNRTMLTVVRRCLDTNKKYK